MKQAKISINGDLLTEIDPVTGKEKQTISESNVHKVKAGKVSVYIHAPGYADFTEEIIVPEGVEITHLTTTPKKKEAPAP